jgi:hypothetical protein
MSWSEKVAVHHDGYNRIYLCVPHNSYGYVCYKKSYIFERELSNPDTEYTKISIWIPEFMDSYLLKKRLKVKELAIVQGLREKEWEGCCAFYTRKSILVSK